MKYLFLLFTIISPLVISAQSLNTGATPYSSCYGKNTSCDYQGCSDFEVIASRDSDVIFILKKNNRVYRHVYIKAGSSITIEVPNGTYQPFFYYGSNWSSYEKSPSIPCIGRFKNNELVGKDSPQTLVNQILTYTLISSVNGNFSQKSSNLDEAF